MFFIDTHSHLYLEHFNNDLDQVISQAIEKKIRKILLPNIDSRSIQPMKQLVSAFPDVFMPMMGLHPTSVKKDFKNEFEIIKDELVSGNYIAIGETGIDLYWDKMHLEEQSQVFEQEIQLAASKNIPLIIHARESFDEIFEILRKYRNSGIKGIFHAFSGTIEQAFYVIDMGFIIGVGGMVTYKNSSLANVIREIDLNHIVLETDAPFLSPVPKRGMRNEPAFLVFTAETVARIKSLTLADIARLTTINASKLFQIDITGER